MDLNETAAFVSVIQEGSFTAAARHLGVPKSTLSRQVSRLEERLGVRLMQRTTRKLHLTEAGAAYFERCQKAVQRIEEADTVALEFAGVPRGLLRVASPHAMRAIWPLLDLEGFMDKYPDITLDLHESQRSIDLVAEGIDVSLRGGELPDSSLIARRLTRSTMFFAASPEYLERRGTPQTPVDLDTHDILVFRPAPRVGPWKLEGPQGVIDWRPTPRFAVNSFGLLVDLAVAGRGIAMCQSVMTLNELAEGKLVRVLPEYAMDNAAFWIVHPSAALTPLKVRVFVDHVAHAAKENLEPLLERLLPRVRHGGDA